MPGKRSLLQELRNMISQVGYGLVFWAAAFTLLISLLGGRRRSRYRKVDGQWTWWSAGNSAFDPHGTILNADPESFIVLHARYAKDKARVFFKWHTIQGAEPDSFEILPFRVGASGRVYSRDCSHVYLKQHQILGADPETFVVIDAPYARDRSRVYCGTVPMDGADPKSFQIMSMSPCWSTTCNKEYFVRFNGPAFADLEVSQSRPAITSDGCWAKDAEYHYRGAARVLGADYATFHATDGICGADKDYEYIGPFRKEEFERRAATWADW